MSNQDSSPCAICTLPLNASKTHALSCDHQFHTACIIGHFRSAGNACPTCRDREGLPEMANTEDIEKRMNAFRHIQILRASRRVPVLIEAKNKIRDAIYDFQISKSNVKRVYSHLRHSQRWKRYIVAINNYNRARQAIPMARRNWYMEAGAYVDSGQWDANKVSDSESETEADSDNVTEDS